MPPATAAPVRPRRGPSPGRPRGAAPGEVRARRAEGRAGHAGFGPAEVVVSGAALGGDGVIRCRGATGSQSPACAEQRHLLAFRGLGIAAGT